MMADGTSSTGRTLHLTDKGAEYQKEMKGKAYKGLIKQLKATGIALSEAIAENDRSLVQKRFDDWKHHYVEFVQTHQVLVSLLDENEKAEFQVQHDGHLEQFNSQKAQVESFLATHSPPQKRASGASVSGSRRSNASQAVQDKLFLMKVEEMKLKAEKDVKASMASTQLELQKKREKMEKEMAQEQEMLDQEIDRKMSEARIKVLCAAEEEGNLSASETASDDDADSGSEQNEEEIRSEKASGEKSIPKMMDS